MVIKFSRKLTAVVVTLHLVAFAMVMLTALPLWARFIMLLMILLSMIYQLARDVFFLLPGSWREFSLDQDGVTIVTRDGASFQGRIAQDSVVSPYLIVLRVKQEGKFLLRSRVLFPDSLEQDAFRRTCVLLRYS